MSISYRTNVVTPIKDDFSVKLNETQNLFKQKYKTSVIGESFKDVLTDEGLFNAYVSALTEGMDATEAAQIEQMANSFKVDTLSESISGIQPFASLTMPVLVKLWAKLSLKYAVPTTPVQTPAFTVSFNKPYILDVDGVTKHYLPESINMFGNKLAELRQLPLNAPVSPATTVAPEQFGLVSLTDGKVNAYDMFQGADTVCPDYKNKPVKGSYMFHIDPKVTITELVFPASTAGADDIVVKTEIKLDTYRRFYDDVEYQDGSTAVTDTVMGSVDLETGKLTIMSMSGKLAAARVQAFISSETHQVSTTVGFEIDRKDINIGTGEHIEANLPLEFLQDVKAMYNIDGTSELVDIMSNITQQKLDERIYTFLKNSYIKTEGLYHRTFNCIPSAVYAVNPSDYLRELRKLIDNLAHEIRGDFKSYNGYFVIIGHPIDTAIIPDVNWTFESVNDTNAGVDVSYSLGAMSGSFKYSIISSDLIDAGELLMFFVSTNDRFKTYEYYPYSFNVVHNYQATLNSNVPSVMLTKRDTIEEFTPIISRIEILNNNGAVYNPATPIATH